MELDELIRRLDRVAANVERLETVWERVAPLIPTYPAAGAPPEYDDLSRQWRDLRLACPPIDGYSITADIPEYNSHALGFVDLDPIESMPLFEEGERPGKELGEYRHRLGRARRKAIGDRLQTLTSQCEGLILDITATPGQDPAAAISSPATTAFERNVQEIEQLLGDTVIRAGRWIDLQRHMHFSQPHDWDDIRTTDWPSVRADIEAAGVTGLDPLEVPMEDLGQLVVAPTGVLRVGLAWEKLSDDQFEELLYDLLRSYEGHENVKWLTNTHAPDRGRDLSMDRHFTMPDGQTRFESVMVQAKHWLTKSVSTPDLTALVGQAESWPVPFPVVVVATSGTFTTEAVTYADARNGQGRPPRVELWARSHLESMLSQRPHLAAARGLR